MLSVWRNYLENLVVDWKDCPLVEVNPRKLSGVPILVGTRVQAAAIVENYVSGSPIEEISENFDLSQLLIRDVLAYAAQQKPFIKL